MEGKDRLLVFANIVINYVKSQEQISIGEVREVESLSRTEKEVEQESVQVRPITKNAFKDKIVLIKKIKDGQKDDISHLLYNREIVILDKKYFIPTEEHNVTLETFIKYVVSSYDFHDSSTVKNISNILGFFLKYSHHKKIGLILYNIYKVQLSDVSKIRDLKVYSWMKLNMELTRNKLLQLDDANHPGLTDFLIHKLYEIIYEMNNYIIRNS